MVHTLNDDSANWRTHAQVHVQLATPTIKRTPTHSRHGEWCNNYYSGKAAAVSHYMIDLWSRLSFDDVLQQINSFGCGMPGDSDDDLGMDTDFDYDSDSSEGIIQQ